jgi:Zn-dependent alcohol dehydrogenase
VLWSLTRWLVSGQFMGIVAEVGPDVKNFHPGDRVVVSCIIACGVCRCPGACAAACLPATFELQKAAVPRALHAPVCGAVEFHIACSLRMQLLQER